jgi:phenylpropionate dioxygenase-like ring-hydroxylating dioxygenase large terminal subunit
MPDTPIASRTGPVAGPFSGFYQRDVPQPDWDLAATGPGTKMGEYMRRFWQPLCFTSDLTDLPKLVRILGEDLVAYRDGEGRIGVLHRHCCHRGTSLEYGRVEARGLRCCYHGWLFDADGTVLETPGEPPQSRLKNAVYQGAYPAVDIHGLVHVYMGPPEMKPGLPDLDLLKIPGLRFVPSSVLHSNNWLQSFENNMDPFHGQFLHTRNTPHFGDHYLVLPYVDWKITPDGRGIFYSAARRVNDDYLWIRLFHCMFPNYAFVASLFDLNMDEPLFQRTFWLRRIVPIDDEHCTFFSWRLVDEGEFAGGDISQNGANSIDFDGQTERATYEEKQRTPGDWEAQGGQRAVAVHKLENLGTTDTGIVMLRRGLRSILAERVPGALPIPESEGPPPADKVMSSNNVLKIAKRQDPAEERAHSFAVSREVVRVVSEAAALEGDARRLAIIAGLRDVEARFA